MRLYTCAVFELQSLLQRLPAIRGQTKVMTMMVIMTMMMGQFKCELAGIKIKELQFQRLRKELA